MPDVKLAVQDAIFTALNVPAVTDLAPLVQHVPEDWQPPLVIIADIVVEPYGLKNGGLDRTTVDVVTISREPSRRPLYTMQAAVRALLDGTTLVADGLVALKPVEDSSEDQLLDDGQTYQGTQRFTMFAQPA